MAGPPKDRDRRYWLDQPRNIDRLFHGLLAVCAALLLAGLLVHGHSNYGFDGWFGFYPAWGFACYALIVLAGTLLRRLIKRDESYYD